MAAIRRNTKRSQKVLSGARDILCFNQANCFQGEPMTNRPAYYRAGSLHETTQSGYLSALLDMFSFAKLREHGDNRYRLDVTANEWYEFEN